MSYAAGYKRARPDDFVPGYDVGIPYGPPGDFGPPLGAMPGPGLDVALPAVGVGLGSGPDGQMPVVKLRGLPFTCDEQEVKMFLETDTVDIVFVKRQGRFSGEAFVVLPGLMQVDFAMGKHRAYMGKRYVEVQPAHKEEYYKAVAAMVDGGHSAGGGGGRSNFNPLPDRAMPHVPGIPPGAVAVHHAGFPRDLGRAPHVLPPPLGVGPANGGGGEGPSILRLRGLPFSASREDVAAWFSDSGAISRPLDVASVHLVMAYDGRPTGTGFVEFADAREALAAMSRDKAMMGSRYVELFPSSRDEVSQATAGAF